MMKQENKTMGICGRGRTIAAGLCVFLLAAATFAKELVIGEVLPLTGPVSSEAESIRLGVRIFFEQLNAHGGVNGNPVKVVVVNDSYKTDETVQLVQEMDQSGALALLVPFGAAPMIKMLKDGQLDRAKMPIVGMIPGAEAVRDPLNPYLFHIRAGDRDQLQKIVEHLLTLGVNRVGVAYADMPMGKGNLAIVEQLLKQHNMEPVARTPLAPWPNVDFNPAIKGMKDASPNAVVIVSPSKQAAQFMKGYREGGGTAPIYTLSYADQQTMLRVAGAQAARGVIISQVYPNIEKRSIPVVKEFRDAFTKYAPAETVYDYQMLEGYVCAKVLTEAMRRAGPNPGRAEIKKSLEHMRDFDLGGFIVDFSETKHKGSAFVDLSVMDERGKLLY
jgi:branched-chain amino acid transport system substrate-binding protein